jgi:multidrug resistance efflux pump
MQPSVSQRLVHYAAFFTLPAVAAGCGQTPAVKADHAAGSAIARVEVVKPERGPIRRSTEQPGQIEAYEVTPIYAKVSGYVERWNVDIGTKVKKGEALAVLSVPELEAEAEQKQALVEESEAKLAQARASEEVAQANLASAQAKLAEVQAGVKRAGADLARWQSEFRRVEQLFNERAQTGTLLDETRQKLRASESARDEVNAQVKSAEAAVRQA